MRPVTPRGFRDVLPEEAAEREALQRRLGDVFSAWGYGLVETPVVERLDALEAAAGSLEGTAFRLVDLDGQLLALRPDVTVPIARLVASRMGDEVGPHRLRYCANVFREHESLRGQSRQFTQVGVELVGARGPAADAEVVAMLVEALRAAGLSRFSIGMGTVEVFQAIVDAAGAGETWGAAVFAAAHDRNLVELDRLAAEPDVAPRAAAALRAVPRIRGGVEAIEACRSAASGCGCDGALDDLQTTYELLESAGVADKVAVDFSVMRSFDYYTGLVVEAYAPGLGVPLGGGGRYDGVLAAFDAPSPAAGFALGLERVAIALVEQDGGPRTRGLDAVLGGEPGLALEVAARLRGAGWRVTLSQREGSALVREAEHRGAVEALVATGKGLYRLDRSGEVALPIEDPIPYAPTTSWAQGGEAL
ncbi:MAG: ATP phosphoribosyltransferase regulatory subunit [Actinobacteria bacterium HGW-Actinobacteria-7]|jgi:ATP phosphoribosyltransferase regulatory subunit|nr:MAG: ATP phosphoribosyltransferase regulatory subunit [Actinobacteria bacterium HGW-Actinobacteria-7]